jgi:hypothetical protein
MAQFNTVQWNGGDGSGVNGVAVTASGLIYQALRSIGVIRAKQGASPDVIDDCFTYLNQMVDSWNTEALVIPATQRLVFDLSAGKADYTLGPGGDLDAVWPERIERAGIILTTTAAIESPIKYQSLSERAGVSYKDGTGIPVAVYDDQGFPLRTLSLWPVPANTVGTLSLALYLPVMLGGFADLDTAYSFRPGYAQALWSNLALLIAPAMEEHSKIKSSRLQMVADIAVTAKARIKSANQGFETMGIDEALRSRGPVFDWRRG